MEIPPSFVDSVFSMEVMRDPVITRQGQTFEREDITEWIRVKGTCPMTREPLSTADLTPNFALRCGAPCAVPRPTSRGLFATSSCPARGRASCV